MTVPVCLLARLTTILFLFTTGLRFAIKIADITSSVAFSETFLVDGGKYHPIGITLEPPKLCFKSSVGTPGIIAGCIIAGCNTPLTWTKGRTAAQR